MTRFRKQKYGSADVGVDKYKAESKHSTQSMISNHVIQTFVTRDCCSRRGLCPSSESGPNASKNPKSEAVGTFDEKSPAINILFYSNFLRHWPFVQYGLSGRREILCDKHIRPDPSSELSYNSAFFCNSKNHAEVESKNQGSC